MFGVPAVAVAAIVVARTGSLDWPRLGLLASLRFALFFIQGSLLGGVDVASRVMRHKLTIRPEVRRHRWRLPPGWPRLVAIATVCLQPGSLAVIDTGESLEIHVLDHATDVAACMARIESLIAAAAGLALDHEVGR